MSLTTPVANPKRRTLPGLPTTSLTPQQQLEALRRVQNQAELRVKLGTQLFKAAEARVSQHQVLLDTVRAEQEQFRAKFSEDIVKSLQTYDRWVGQIEETLTDGLHELEAKIDKLQAQWTDKHEHAAALVVRSEALLNQGRDLLRSTQDKLVRQTAAVRQALAQRPAPAAPRASVEPVPETKPRVAFQDVAIDPALPVDAGRTAAASLDDTAQFDAIPLDPAEVAEAIAFGEPTAADLTPVAQMDQPDDEPTLTVAPPPEAELESAPEIDQPPAPSSHLYRDILAQLHEQRSRDESAPGSAN